MSTCRESEDGNASPGSIRRLKELLAQPDNQICADCSSSDPKWASTNIGVFICIKCSGVHRSLGVHISKVLSLTLDEWTDGQVDAMVDVGGNASANAIYEAFLPKDFKKPGPEASFEERSNFIKHKYELQEFVKPSLRIVSSSSSSLSSSFQHSSAENNIDSIIEKHPSRKMIHTSRLSGLGHAFRKSWRKKEPENKETKRNASSQVFDKDTFSSDDSMGEAEVDIQPLVSAAKAYENVGVFGSMQIGKWLATSDNALVRDSIIHLIDGQAKQDISLKLQNVESGILDLELECVPLSQ